MEARTGLPVWSFAVRREERMGPLSRELGWETMDDEARCRGCEGRGLSHSAVLFGSTFRWGAIFRNKLFEFAQQIYLVRYLGYRSQALIEHIDNLSTIKGRVRGYLDGMGGRSGLVFHVSHASRVPSRYRLIQASRRLS